MLVSYKLLKEYVDLKDLSVKEICDTLTLAGFELESVKQLSSGDHLVIGEVLECENHPNSDHLHITKTSIGNELLQIVCGAPNCRKGLKVIVALPGANLPAKGITIAKGEIRGVESNGMLCSLVELGVPESMLSDAQKEGIEELNSDAIVGDTNPLAYLNLDDTIIDFSVTPNRCDVLGLNHFFKEVAAVLDTKVIKEYEITYKPSAKCDLTASSNTPLCDYFAITHIYGIKVMPSPKWMQDILSKHDIKCIDNVVDIGNYVTLMTGQPLHMYDANKLKSKSFVVKNNVDCKVVALDDKEYEIKSGDLVVTNNDEVVCIAGVIGGNSSMIDESTTEIALETALFDGITIANSAKRYGLSTVAATNYSKNAVDRYNPLYATKMACDLLVKYASATCVSETYEYDKRNLTKKVVEISLDFINNRLGSNYTSNDVKDVFRRLAFSYKENNGVFEIEVPTYRNDISIKEDIVEEVVRLIGFDTIPYTISNVEAKDYGLNDVQRARNIISNYLLDIGLTNTLSYTLIKKEDAEYYSAFDKETYIVLPHPLTVEKEYLRKNMMYSMLSTISYNQARNIKDVAIFEMSEVYTNENLQGKEKLSIAISNSLNQTKWQNTNIKTDFYTIKGIVEGILALFGIDNNRYSFEPLNKTYNNQTIFHPGKSAILKINGREIGMLGEIHPTTLKKEGIEPTVYFEMNLTEFLNIKTSKVKYTPVSKFPSVSRDIALVVKDDVSINSIIRSMKKAGGPLLNNVEVFDVYKGEHVSEGYKSVALSMTFVDSSKTLVDQTINELFSKIYAQCQKDFNAVIRQ